MDPFQMEKVKIMPAAPTDARAIVEVYYRTWLDTYPNKEAGITVEDIEYSYKDHFTPESIRKRE